MREFSPVSPWRWLRPGLSVKPVESSLWNAKSIDFSLLIFFSSPPSTSSFLACQFCELKDRLLLGFRERTVIGEAGGGDFIEEFWCWMESKLARKFGEGKSCVFKGLFQASWLNFAISRILI